MRNLVILNICLVLVSVSANAGSAPKFTGSHKEIIEKCKKWAEKETASIKDSAKQKAEYRKLGETCSWKNGVEPKG